MEIQFIQSFELFVPMSCQIPYQPTTEYLSSPRILKIVVNNESKPIQPCVSKKKKNHSMYSCKNGIM